MESVMQAQSKRTESTDRSFLAVALGVLFWLACPVPGWSGEPVNTGYFGNVAIKGYDPVAYFTDGKATSGSENITYKWLGAYWHFENDEHRQLFAEDPTAYAPQYGGFCASGMGIHGGRTSDIDPEAWLIIDGKLYLNYSKETNTLITDGIVDLNKADANWIDSAQETN
jgi:hypothetical protein